MPIQFTLLFSAWLVPLCMNEKKQRISNGIRLNEKMHNKVKVLNCILLYSQL